MKLIKEKVVKIISQNDALFIYTLLGVSKNVYTVC